MWCRGREVDGGEDSDEEVAHPVGRVKNTHEEEEGGQPDVIIVVDGEVPQDDENPCKFSTVLYLQHDCARCFFVF